jgi:hypothetical protein
VSPPRRARDILVHSLAPHVVRPPFQSVMSGGSTRSREDVTKEAGLNPKVNIELAKGVKEMNVSGKLGESGIEGSGKGGVKE